MLTRRSSCRRARPARAGATPRVARADLRPLRYGRVDAVGDSFQLPDGPLETVRHALAQRHARDVVSRVVLLVQVEHGPLDLQGRHQGLEVQPRAVAPIMPDSDAA